MIIKNFKKNEKIEFNKEEKFCKYSIKQNEAVMKFSRGRAMEFHLRTAYGYKTLELENIPHWIAGDIKIEDVDFNIKSRRCELKAEGLTIQEKIENYIASDASQGMIYIVEHNEEVIEIRMSWAEAREFINTFAKLDRGNIRINTCDNKIYNWAISKVA